MRTSVERLAGILEVDMDSVPDLTPFIETANSLVTNVCAPLEYGETTLELIERWLAAHFYSIRDPLYASEGAGGVSASYEGQTGKYLEFTRYGQQALLLDTKGGLATLNKSIEGGGRRPSIMWLGTSKDYPYA